MRGFIRKNWSILYRPVHPLCGKLGGVSLSFEYPRLGVQRSRCLIFSWRARLVNFAVYKLTTLDALGIVLMAFCVIGLALTFAGLF
jgi:hypothetical protein